MGWFFVAHLIFCLCFSFRFPLAAKGSGKISIEDGTKEDVIMAKIYFTDTVGSHEIEIPASGAVFGRNPDCDIVVLEGSVSGHHGRFEKRGDQWWVVDTGSSNGTKVNTKPTEQSPIKDGDMLVFGDVAVRFSEEAAPTPSAAPAVAPAMKTPSNGLPGGLKLPPSANKPVLPAGVKLPPSMKGPVVSKSAGKPASSGPAPKAGKPAPAAPAATHEAAPAPATPKATEAPAPAPAKAAESSYTPEAFSAPAIATGDWKAPELKIDPNYKTPEMSGSDIETIDELNAKYKELIANISEVVIGQADVVEQVLVAVFARGHALLMGVPGLAKTLLISTLSHVLDLGFKRVQFTPDLMPSDITGTDVLEENRSTGERSFRFVKGPIFTNMLLADEINRTPPKTQAALLEAMQEHHITVGSQTYALPKPFFVLATQNPIEQEGTYPLPEAQMDRFLFNIIVDYPSAEDESTIIKNVTSGRHVELKKVMDGDAVLRIQDVVKRVPVAPHVIDFARNLVRATRPKQPEAPDFVKEMVGWGAGPRAGLSLINAAKARAVLHGRHHCTTADVVDVALPVLRHRCITTFAAEAAGVKSDEIVKMLLKVLRSSDLADI